MDNVADFFAAGCLAVGVGSSLITAKILETDDWAALKELAVKFVARLKIV